MGEFEYSRSDARFWRDGMEKMKALGCDTVQSYVIWIHHEEIKGEYDFSGNKDLRAFLKTVKDAGMMMFLRIGPWVHAEVRNGGFPDWIYDEGYKLRTDDPAYLACVKQYFSKIYEQCRGYLYSEGGPIFAIQIENEYRKGSDPEAADAHIRSLERIIKEVGFEVPVYIATAWGESAVGDAIPSFGVYCEAPWEFRDDVLEPLDVYLIEQNPAAVRVGEYEIGETEQYTYDLSKQKTPYITVEEGTGVQITKMRRPICTGADSAAMQLCKLGQGISAVGYYVFHGGINPDGKLSTMQEFRDLELTKTKKWGFFCDLSEKNYDFQAPISMYGRISDMGDELKLLNVFTSEFSELLATSDVYIPKDGAKRADDLESPRYSVRAKDGAGFLFINNYIRSYDLPSRSFSGFSPEGSGMTFPDFEIKNKEFVAYPFNIPVGEKILRYATATPLCILNGKDIVLYSESGEADLSFVGDGDGRVILLKKEEAKRAYKIKVGDREHLVIARGEVFSSSGKTVLRTTEQPKIKVYPELSASEFAKIGTDGIFTLLEAKEKRVEVSAKVVSEKLSGEDLECEIALTYGEGIENAYLDISFSGDNLDLYLGDKKINDRFYSGTPLEIGLKHHNFPEKLRAVISPLREDSFVYVEKKPLYRDGVARSLDSLAVYAEYEYEITR